MDHRAYYAEQVGTFMGHDSQFILGRMVERSTFAVEAAQRDAWMEQIKILKSVLVPYVGRGKVYFEYSVPRLGRRIDTIVLVDHVLFVVEFKVGENSFLASAIDQVWDYALDLKHFHETSHNAIIVPILVATAAQAFDELRPSRHRDGLLMPIRTSAMSLPRTMEWALADNPGVTIDADSWESGRYCPTPTIIEAARALYDGHDVSEISRNDALAINLTRTSDAISKIICESRANSRKSICLVTGVPGAGKTLVGLNIATKYLDPNSELYSVFLSGNEPLVAVLREALARDRVEREAEAGHTITKGNARVEVKSFIQNVHHFRDECLLDRSRPPIEHVALFDEAQRAWNVEQTSKFMRAKKKVVDFNQSEPEFLVSCLDRHLDWAVVVCLIGGGQEINTGEAGMSEWLRTIQQRFPHWDVYASPRIRDAEYATADQLQSFTDRSNVFVNDDLHLAVSMRSFRAESVAGIVAGILEQDVEEAQRQLKEIQDRYPIVLTRDLDVAKQWLRDQARGSERYGIIVSSEAHRLKPLAINVRASIEPIHWFLDPKEDVRSSYYLEDVGTQFDVQGLELDWTCVVWDADFRYTPNGWRHYSFAGSRWNQVKSPERQVYLKNAYRVLLTRARQGMVIVVPHGNDNDRTRQHEFYDETCEYLRRIGIPTIGD